MQIQIILIINKIFNPFLFALFIHANNNIHNNTIQYLYFTRHTVHHANHK